MQVISTDSVCKRFGSSVAAERISITINEGEIYGFLGLNGAGKTTLIRMLLGMVTPDSGSIYLFGSRLTRNFKHWNEVGYLVETPYSYPELSVFENLLVYYHLRKLNNSQLIDAIIERLRLGRFRNIKARLLSLGNQQRLGLAKALMHRPKLLILDEPVNGLDPEGIVEIRDLMKELVSGGSTIFLSSHILTEVSRVADRIGIIHQGKLVKEQTINEVNAALKKKLIVDTNENFNAMDSLKTAGINAVLNPEGELEFNNQQVGVSPEEISALLVKSGFSLRKLYLSTEDLEIYFLRTINSEK